MRSTYQEYQREKQINLIKNSSPVFYNALAGMKFMRSERDFVLIDSTKNLFISIRKDVLEYFKLNQIAWWGGYKPSGHVLSSQIACLNHLFHLRNDKMSVLSILKSISNDFVDVLQIGSDRYFPGFIQFEAVSDRDYLNEGIPTRGNNCTSIDALIYALHRDGSKYLIPIEWKYTEHYNNQNKATEGFSHDPINCKGEKRKERYTQLINNSMQLINVNHHCFYFEPFYQLMRQTLWVEQMIIKNGTERLKADNYIHVHIVPFENSNLLQKSYPCSGMNMENTWRKLIRDQTKYKIISPMKLLSGLNNERYSDLLKYLSIRYWNG